MAFAVAAGALTLTLAGLALGASTLPWRGLQQMATQGPAVKRTGGVALIAIGVWFAYLAIANPTYLLP